ncbi:metallophosphoesterase [Devosia sp. LjRoot3]|uniref:metallophosphoesterase n=1 Tax=Devosia sp. LjRoot3 TaxID=3342319 RepID=UPI003ECF48AD
MKIWIFSDLHRRRRGTPWNLTLAPAQADLAVCAGDLSEGDPEDGVAWLAYYVRPNMPVIYVPGNHEYYNRYSSMQDLKEKAKETALQSGIDFLDNEFVDIGDIRFFGSTLWSDFDFFAKGDEARRQRDMAWCEMYMNDFRLIRPDENSLEIWTASRARREHLISRTWLETAMAGTDRRKVVVTHNAPHPGSVAPRFHNDPLTAAFVSDLTAAIAEHHPELWIHGHTHNSSDYRVGDTRVICNPRGYGTENADEFNPGLVVEI